MFTYRKLTTVCCAAVLALGLAACGSSSGDRDIANGNGGDDRKPPPPAVDVAGLLLTAHNSRTASDAAEMAAEQAVKDAMKYFTMFTTVAVHGDSMAAQTNAQKVLDAQAAADKAVMDAEAAKTAAEAAKTEAGGIPAGDANRAAVIAALDAAIEAADDAIKAAKKSQVDPDLEAAVTAVVGADKMNTPVKRGAVVAMAIGGALGPTSATAGDGLRVTHAAADNVAPMIVAADMKSAVMMNDATGMTWAQIVGEDNVMMSRLGEANMAVPIASIAGMTAATVMPKDTPTAGTDGAGYSNADNESNYTGIDGTVHCLGTDCKVTDGKLAGSWYFQPDSPKATYEKVGDRRVYSEEMNYARFGHWLVVVVDDGLATINTYAWTNQVGLVELGVSDTLEEEATYTGSAAGMSLHKTFDSQGERQSIYSGRFTADVTLEANFGAAATVEGTIDNFVGNAVDSTWSVDLKQMPLGTERQSDAGRTDTGGTGQDGEWNARPYGLDAKRPTGIFGDFNAHWTDGHAAGAFATRK